MLAVGEALEGGPAPEGGELLRLPLLLPGRLVAGEVTFSLDTFCTSPEPAI